MVVESGAAWWREGRVKGGEVNRADGSQSEQVFEADGGEEYREASVTSETSSKTPSFTSSL